MTSQPCEVVVLAGGKGTRLRSVTGPLPKALVPVAGRPFIDWKLEQLAAAGVVRVHLLTGFGADQISAHLAQTEQPLDVVVSADGPTPLGTGGALVAYSPNLPERFVVTYGDSLLDAPLRPFWEGFLASSRQAQIAVTRQRDSAKTGNISVVDDRVEKYSRDPDDPDLAWLDYGYLAMSKDLLVAYSGVVPLDLGTLVADAARGGDLTAYRVTERFWEVGTPESYREVEEHLAERN